MRTFLFFLILSLPLTGVGSDKPNFLFIFADDQSYQTIAAHGHTEVITPNLDRLAESGVSFTNAYNMGGWNGAICVASRTMITTGKSVWRAFAAADHLNEAAERGELWSQLLGEAGYETYCTGKWHINIKPETIFDHHIHERPGMPRDSWTTKMQGIAKPELAFIHSLPEYNRPTMNELDVWSPYERSFGGFWEGGKHWSEVLADDATAFLQNAAKSEKPFFMYLAFNAPHDPRQSPKRFVDMYPRDQVEVPASYMPMYPYKDEMGCGPALRDEALAPFPRTEYAVRTHRQEYYAIISHMDEQIGRILKALEETGKKDNTYILFTADHGLACGNHGLIGKQNMYEHSMKPPLIVVGPDVPENEKREALVYLQDIMATTLDLAGVDKPAYVEFNSLMPLIRDAKAESAYDLIYGCYLKDAQRMIRVGNMKLILYPQARRLRLFNLELDPHEVDDLSGNPAYWTTIQELFGMLLDRQLEMGDNLHLASFFPDLLPSYDSRTAWEKLVKTKSNPRVASRPAFEFVPHNPDLPNVLLYGDSISIAYTPTVRNELRGKANVYRLHRNGGDSGKVVGYVEEMFQQMQGKGLSDPWNFDWDMIHFNVGLHDLKYVSDGKLDKVNGELVTTPEQYAENLISAVEYFQKVAPDAKIVFATTTPVPEGEPGRFAGDAEKYNNVARKVLKEFPEIAINDLYSFTKPNQPNWWTEPGNVHFNAEGFDNQGKEVARVIQENLR